jgi:hypothetical protein
MAMLVTVQLRLCSFFSRWGFPRLLGGLVGKMGYFGLFSFTFLVVTWGIVFNLGPLLVLECFWL